MKYVPISPKRILAIDPTTEGLAYAVIEDSPLHLIDWGIKNCGRKKAAALRSATEMIERWQPNVLVMEDYEASSSRRHRRVQRLIQNLIELAGRHRLRVHTFSRIDIRRRFGVKTKDDVAATIAGIFPELLPKLPPRRDFSASEDYRMAIFDAVAMGTTHLEK